MARRPPRTEEEWFEELDYGEYWCEESQRLSSKGDYLGLIALCQQRWERDPEDLHGLEALAYAHLESGDPDTAIGLVEERYREDPEHPLYEMVILDALLAQGKDLDSFKWEVPPKVVLLDSDLLDRLYRYLKPKRKPRYLCDLQLEISGRGHPFFTDEQLLEALQGDQRFKVESNDILDLFEISVRRG